MEKTKENIEKLVRQVAESRQNYLEVVAQFSETQAQFKPNPESWNAIEVTEHLFWAEQGGILGMWKTYNAIKAGQLPRRFDSVHQNLPIETIIERTWQAKEQVPAVAAPRFGGPIAFWASSLASLQTLLTQFGEQMTDEDLRLQAHPHPISGAMDFQQRIEFLRFHIDRHYLQVEKLLTQP